MKRAVVYNLKSRREGGEGGAGRDFTSLNDSLNKHNIE